MKSFSLILSFAILMSAGGAHAQDNLIVDSCFPIERALDRLKTADLKPEKRDAVDSFLRAYFVDVETRSQPMKLYLKYEGVLGDFVVSERGEVQQFHSKVLDAPKATEICGLTQEDGKIGLGMTSTVQFKTSSGVHTLSEILDGARDGKTHHKKNVGGAMALFVPKMTHVAIIYDNPETTPIVSADVNGSSIALEPELYENMWVIEITALKDLRADELRVGGGPYRLLPVPSVKKMRSLGIK